LIHFYKRNMRFLFCGDQDCPDWVLAQIGEISKLSAIRLKQLSSKVILLACSEAKISNEDLEWMAALTKLQQSEVFPSVSALEWIFIGGAKNRVDHAKLAEELEQLGTPREHSSVISRIYKDKRSELEAYLEKKSLRFTSLDSCDGAVFPEEDGHKSFVLDLKLRDELGTRNQSVRLSERLLFVLRTEMETAYNKILPFD